MFVCNIQYVPAPKVSAHELRHKLYCVNTKISDNCVDLKKSEILIVWEEQPMLMTRNACKISNFRLFFWTQFMFTVKDV